MSSGYETRIPSNETDPRNKKLQDLYPKGTTVIADDLIINGVIEEKLNRLVKVRNMDEKQQYLILIIKKKPIYIILHVETSNTTISASRDILNKLLTNRELSDCKH